MKDQEEVYRGALEATLEEVERLGSEILPAETVSRIAKEHSRRTPAERFLFARNSASVGRPEVVRQLVAESFGFRHSHPEAMIALAEVAVELAEALAGGGRWKHLASHLRAEAWANLANARRVGGDLVGAEAAWGRLDQLVEDRPTDLLLQARLLDLRASLRLNQGRPEEATDLLKRAEAQYGALGELRLRERVLIKLSIASRDAGRFQEALHYLVTAGRSLPEAGDPDLLAGLVKDLGKLVDDLGHPHEALLILHLARRLFDRSPDSLIAARVQWLQARILARLGYHGEAAALLERVRARFVGAGLAFTASQVSMELAAAYARLERLDLVEGLAQAMYPVFLSQELPVEATAALALFVKAAKRRRATSGRIASVLRTLNGLESRGHTRAPLSSRVSGLPASRA